jgi:hypothetical protein
MPARTCMLGSKIKWLSSKNIKSIMISTESKIVIVNCKRGRRRGGMLSKGGLINECNKPCATQNAQLTLMPAHWLSARKRRQREHRREGNNPLGKRARLTTHPANPLRVRGRKRKKDQEEEQGELCEHGKRCHSGVATTRNGRQKVNKREDSAREGRRRAKQAPHRLLAAFSSTRAAHKYAGRAMREYSQPSAAPLANYTNWRESGALSTCT